MRRLLVVGTTSIMNIRRLRRLKKSKIKKRYIILRRKLEIIERFALFDLVDLRRLASDILIVIR